MSNLNLQETETAKEIVPEIKDTTKFALETADEIRVQGFIDALDETSHVSAEEQLQLFTKWEEILHLATDAFANERRTFNINLLEKFEYAVTKMVKMELFWEIHNSLVAVNDMLTFLNELRATRAGLCGVISRVAIPEVHAHIELLKEYIEKEREIRAITAQMINWSVERIRAFRTVISEDSP